MKLKTKKIFASLIGVVFLFSGCEKEEVKTEEITTVKPFTVITKDYENFVSYSGYASSDELKRFSFELSGKIDKVLVEKGDMVKAGQVIATLDTTTVQMSIDKANQDIAIAKQDMAIAKQDVQNSKQDVQNAKQDVKNANQDVENANQDVENANQDIANANESVKNADQNIELAKNKITQIDSSIKELNIGLDAEKLTLEKAKTGIDAEKVSLEKIKETYTSSINKLQLNYDNALSTFENTKTLFDKGVCDKNAYDSAKLAFDTISEELTNTKQSMEKDINLQEKKIENMERDYSLQETKIKDMENKIEQAQIQKEAAQISLNQAQTTSNQAKINSNKAEVASNKAQVASNKAQVAADKAKVIENKAGIASNKANIASNKASIAAKEAEIALRQNTKYLADSSLKSTINGYVVETPMKSGEVTSAGNPVVVVKSTVEIVNIAVPSEDYSKFKIGMDATLTQDDKTVYGKITSIDLYPDETTRTYNIEITPSINNAFALGSLINVSISLDKQPSVFVPLSSIVDINGIDYVYCISKNENNQNIVTSKEIKILSTDGENVRISGIESGTIIASDEVKNLRDNQIVNLKEGDSIEK